MSIFLLLQKLHYTLITAVPTFNFCTSWQRGCWPDLTQQKCQVKRPKSVKSLHSCFSNEGTDSEYINSIIIRAVLDRLNACWRLASKTNETICIIILRKKSFFLIESAFEANQKHLRLLVSVALWLFTLSALWQIIQCVWGTDNCASVSALILELATGKPQLVKTPISLCCCC